MVRKAIRNTAAVAAVAVMLGGCGLKRHKYDNPITKDTQQPDKVLFDKAINDIEHSRFEIARLQLQNLINTYDTSEYLAKAKLAIADAWYREGGSHGLAQAEAEYKDFILFYPQMEESAEAQQKVCDIHYKQMEKPDRDRTQALSAQREFKSMIEQFPDNPPMFMRRGPFSYYEPGWIERDLKAAGFSNVDIDTVTLTSRSGSAEEATRGLCYGSPMRVELEEYGRDALDSVYAVLSKSARRFEGASGFEAPMSAHIVTAIK